ncbi:hypothetical protein HDU98_007212, partial [Podochytrium sp. JEL0797]
MDTFSLNEAATSAFSHSLRSVSLESESLKEGFDLIAQLNEASRDRISLLCDAEEDRREARGIDSNGIMEANEKVARLERIVEGIEKMAKELDEYSRRVEES